MLTPAPDYAALCDGFAWDMPERLNMAHQVCDGWAVRDPGRVAIIDVTDGIRRQISYGELWRLSRRVENALLERGVMRGDRVGVLLSQSFLCAAAHIAAWRIGAISVPLFKLFRGEALGARLDDSGASVVVTDDDGAAMVRGMGLAVIRQQDLPDSTQASGGVETGPDDPAVLIYTSGTTGAPKGALHGHRVLTGHLPGVEMSHDFLGQPGDCLWTPADWAWIGGLFDVLMPGLALGVPVVAARMEKFTPKGATRIVDQGGVRNAFFPPTALRMLKAADCQVTGLRSVASGGEPLGAEMLDWGRGAFGLTINEFYGQTECNMVASSAGVLFDPRPGFIGRPAPGHRVAVIDAAGDITDGEGDIAVRAGTPAMMLEYWRKPQATAEKFRGQWMLTGDRGVMEDGFIRFVGREDDVITSAGYRIGPAEIEDCLLTHPAVATVGVVGKPDRLRTQIVKAYVVVKEGVGADDALADALKSWVKERLAAHSYPREIAFLDVLPMTVTGKVIRKDLKARATQEAEGEA
ncbi:AMP-binding protein [Lutimaribacter sp. EGI FJ00015]|uniref:AMP-binding protein n=1 Tax=Lutimaribacter degradans TaxID=2945989 RepID=A0ACC5ZRX7_9RHOB|nr:AMP-binding protein [Lutimaribacter sp. EGI FJ00013]MCM2560847.1 AMP-binding protein [Lutimaribacter sp. EGI FJ00013]MCO0612208.1 AMP-binding protein [Lutimaribacter sp. EGI FJ00015]MCO0634672.1 AMP-binding protein [Lutimaribacter sp. EGI FJ00014]